MVTRDVTIINKLGLHARAAAKFVSTASRYGSSIHLQRGSQRINGKSIMGVMMLAASKGTTLVLTTEGEDEVPAADALQQLIADRFGESE
jgi:phosphotransferase system HPr (HPr) family protein